MFVGFGLDRAHTPGFTNVCPELISRLWSLNKEKTERPGEGRTESKEIT